MFQRSLLGGRGRVTVGTTTWNPSPKGGFITLSNSNYTATQATTSPNSVRSNTLRNLGRYVCRVEHQSGTQGATLTVGVCNVNQSMDSALDNTNGMGMGFGIGQIYVFVDMDVRKMWFVYNSTNYYNGGNPENGTGGYNIPNGDTYIAVSVLRNSTTTIYPTQTYNTSSYSPWQS